MGVKYEELMYLPNNFANNIISRNGGSTRHADLTRSAQNDVGCVRLARHVDPPFLLVLLCLVLHILLMVGLVHMERGGGMYMGLVVGIGGKEKWEASQTVCFLWLPITTRKWWWK
jgi:hypothetical protein